MVFCSMPDPADTLPPRPRFSVVTPSFKQLDWLKLCAASVADQQGVTVEHIVQDAGTGPEMESWAAGRPHLKLVAERDDGMYDAINRGLKLSRGEICAYLNCDEQYLPGALEKVSAFFEAHPEVDVVFADAVLVNSEGTPLSYRRAVLPTTVHTRLVHLNTLSCATFFRHSVVERGFFFDPSYRDIGDAVWVHRLITEGIPMAVLQEPTTIFTFTGENRGAAENVKVEGRRWRKAPGTPSAFLKYPAIVVHRIKKFLAGAYKPRSCAVQIYTLDIPARRTELFVPRIGFGWPRIGNKKAESAPGQRIPGKPAGELKIAAVFTSYNRSKVALRCLECLLGQSRKLFRIVVAENNSTDNTRDEIQARFGDNPEVDLVVLPDNLGNSGGIRIAMQRALNEGADAVWILDDDSWPHPDSLEKLLVDYTGAAVFSSLVLDPAKKDLSWPYMLTRTKHRLAGTLESLPKQDLFEVRGAWLGSLVSRSILESAGLPDERLFIRGEDEEFPLRIKQHGYRFFCVKNSILDHPAPQRLIRLHLFGVNFFYEPHLAAWKAYYMVRNRVFIYRKYSRSTLEGLAKAAASVFLAICIALLRDDQKFKRVLVYLRAGWHGLTNRVENQEIPRTG
jgi:GT2 family glycosyltransferase